MIDGGILEAKDKDKQNENVRRHELEKRLGFSVKHQVLNSRCTGPGVPLLVDLRASAAHVLECFPLVLKC